jgi:hypothetical protein
MITLTVAEILDLARFAGIPIADGYKLDEDEGEAEIAIVDCPTEGILNDEGQREHTKYVAYFTDCPDDGSSSLGVPLAITADGVPKDPTSRLYADD